MNYSGMKEREVTYQLMMLDTSCDEAVGFLAGRFGDAGLRVVITFKLCSIQAPAALEAEYDLPLSKLTACSSNSPGCQMVVLLVYGVADTPVALVVNSHGEQSWINLVDTPQQRPPPSLVTAIHEALSLTAVAPGPIN